MILRELLPERSAEDIAAGRIRLTFGILESARTVDLSVLPISANRIWKERLEKSLGGVWEGLEGVADGSKALAWLGNQTFDMVDLLQAYDARGVMPDKEWILDNATDQQVLSAFLGVAAAAHPLAASLIEAASSNSELMHLSLLALSSAFSAHTSSAPPSTAGSPKKSKKS